MELKTKNKCCTIESLTNGAKSFSHLVRVEISTFVRVHLDKHVLKHDRFFI